MNCPSCGHKNAAEQKFCGECGTRLAAAPAEAERRQLTVMFCDLVESTQLSRRLDPEDLREVIRAYQGAAAQVIDKYEGHVAQYLGDGILVYFGYPKAHEQDAERAVRAGREIVGAIHRLDEELISKHQVELEVRVGIHTGPVVVGEMGAGERRETLALGDTTNIAARLQGVARPGEVVISEATLRLVAGLFITKDLGAPALKGVDEAISAYAVVRPSGVRSRLEANQGRLTPLVGREQELELLLSRWEKARNGEGQAVLLSGEAGVGKSRLLHAFHRRLAGQSHSWFECRSTPYTQGSALHPLIELLQGSLGFRKGDDGETRLRRLERGVEGGGLHGPDVVPFIAPLLRIPLSDRYPPRQESPALQRKKTIEALVSWLLALADRQPVVMLIEDLHWSDASTVEFLGSLLERSESSPLLTLLSFRPEFEPPWSERDHVTRLDLGRLPTGDAEKVIDGVTGGVSLPEAVVARIVERADGVPLFLEELTKMVTDSDRVARRGGRYELVGELTDLAIPTTLQDSLMARLDKLAEGKPVAQRAAALGRECGYELLEAISPTEGTTLRQGLAQLVDAELLYQRGSAPAATYTFKHAMVRDAAYQSMLKGARRALHAQIAGVFEERFPERVDAEPEVIARHCEEAGLVDAAIEHYQRAGELAFQRWANPEAIGHLRRALEILDETPDTPERDRREIGLQLAIAAPLTGSKGYNHPESESAYERAHVLASKVGDVPELPRVLLGLSRPRITKGDFSESTLELSREALAAAERSGDRFFVLSAHQLLGSVLLFRGEFPKALVQLNRAIELYDPELHRPLAHLVGYDQGPVAQRYAAWSLWPLGYADQALVLSKAALAQAQEGKQPLSIVLALSSGVWIHFYRQELEETRQAADTLIQACERFGIPAFIVPALAFRGWARVQLGEVETGLSDLHRSVAMHRELGWRIGEPVVLGLLGSSLAAARHIDEADRKLREGLKVAEATQQHMHDSELYRLRGELALAREPVRSDETEKLFQRALEVARHQDAKGFELRVTTGLARSWHSQGKIAEARDLLAPVYDWFTEGFDTRDLKEAKALLEELG